MCPDQRRLALGLYRTPLTPDLLETAQRAGIRHIDCAYNYGNFRYLALLGTLGAPERFSISSKVGYFTAPSGTEHSLVPDRLTQAAERTAERLGRAADLLFLHNPETSLSDDQHHADQQLAAACEAMANAVEAGLARTWGIATWDAGNARLRAAISQIEHPPTEVMVRVGLSIPGAVLQAGTDLIERLDLPPSASWGMSPLGGRHAQEVIDAANYTPFITDTCTNSQAALRLAYDLPPVGTVCLSTSSPDHLREAADAVALETSADHLARYRALIPR